MTTTKVAHKEWLGNAMSGTITVTVHGNKLSVSLSGGGGSASFALSK